MTIRLNKAIELNQFKIDDLSIDIYFVIFDVSIRGRRRRLKRCLELDYKHLFKMGFDDSCPLPSDSYSPITSMTDLIFNRYYLHIDLGHKPNRRRMISDIIDKILI